MTMAAALHLRGGRFPFIATLNLHKPTISQCFGICYDDLTGRLTGV
jgi:hypothetical protein